jgi:hypothetical protein
MTARLPPFILDLTEEQLGGTAIKTVGLIDLAAKLGVCQFCCHSRAPQPARLMTPIYMTEAARITKATFCC